MQSKALYQHLLTPTRVAHLAHAHHRHLRRKQQTIAKELDVLMRKRRSSAQLKLLEELVRCCWSAQGGSSSAPERAQERGQDQGQREATSNERRPREALPHLLQPPASPEPSGSSSCPASNKLIQSQIKIVVYEPLMSTLDMDSVVEFVDTVDSLDEETDLILTNRMDEKILKYESKIFTRDLYGDN